MSSTKPKQWLEFDSPWAFQPGRVRVLQSQGELSRDDLWQRLYRNEMILPYLVETTYERRLHFTRDVAQTTMLFDEPDSLTSAYTREMMSFLLFNPAPKGILMIGLGGGSLAKFCYRRLTQTRITVVEISADVIALRDEFCIPQDDERLRIIQADGALYLEGFDDTVDAILIDAFDSQGVAPSLLMSSFFSRCAAQLSPSGVLVMNLSGQQTRYVDTLRQVRKAFGKKMLLLEVANGDNVLLFASKEAPPKILTDELAARARDLQAQLQLEFPAYLKRICEGHSLVS
jgi:spermidine synthase